MATAKELVVGSVWGFLGGSGAPERASSYSIKKALETPISITGDRKERWALTSSHYFSYDREVNGLLATCSNRPWGAPMVQAITGPGSSPSRAADREPERVLPDTYVITSGRGFYPVEVLRSALVKAKARESASVEAEIARRARIAELEAVVSSWSPVPHVRAEVDTRSEAIVLRFATVDAFRAYTQAVTP